MARVIKRERLCIDSDVGDEDLFSILNKDEILLSEELMKRIEYGDESAYYDIGIKYYKAGNYTKALHWIQKSAAKNYSFAQKHIGAMYKNGTGVPKDYKRAMTWYLKAVENDRNKYAQFWIGELYEKGLGVTKDIHAAIQWYTKAADQSLPLAQRHLSGLFEHEEQVKDLQKAVEWAQKAFDSGYKYLFSTIERLNAQGYYAQYKSEFDTMKEEDTLITIEDSLDPTKSEEQLNDSLIDNIYEQQHSQPITQEEISTLKLIEEKLKTLEDSFEANLQHEKAEKTILQKRLDTIEQDYIKKERMMQQILDDMQQRLHFLENNKVEKTEQIPLEINQSKRVKFESEKAKYEREKAKYEMGKARYEREQARFEREKAKYAMGIAQYIMEN